MDDLERFFAFGAHRHALLSTRTEPFEGGIAYFDDDYPDRYMSNFLLVVRDDPAITGDRLAPKSLYERLGFDPISRAWEFMCHPSDDR